MKMHVSRWSAVVMVALAAVAGCKKEPTPKVAASTTNPTGPEVNKIRVGYIGLSCEAPIFTAVEKGFFKEEGLEVEMVRCQWAQYKDVLALGGFDITHHLVMYFLKPIEQGMDVKFTGGIHRGCLRVQAPANSPITSVKDLRGKRIGVPGMGTPPFIFATRVLGANGIDASKEIEWRVFNAGELGLALEKGLAVAVANTERADPGGVAPALNALSEHGVQGGGAVTRALNRMPRKLGRPGLGGLARFY